MDANLNRKIIDADVQSFLFKTFISIWKIEKDTLTSRLKFFWLKTSTKTSIKMSLHIQSVAKQGSINQSGSGILTDFFRLSTLSISGYSECELQWNWYLSHELRMTNFSNLLKWNPYFLTLHRLWPWSHLIGGKNRFLNAVLHVVRPRLTTVHHGLSLDKTEKNVILVARKSEF